MSGFSWKKKTGQPVVARQKLAAAFPVSDDDEDDDAWSGDSPARLQLPSAGADTPPPTDGGGGVHPALSPSEQAAALREQGGRLAELDRFWEALSLWDEAAALTPGDATLHEMRAQALLAVHELWPALEAASTAAQLSPRWWEAHQTLGRTLLGLGELGLARRAFSVAAHLRPDDLGLRTDDLLWSCVLLERLRRRPAGDGGVAGGGVVSPEQTARVRRLLRLEDGVSAAAERCHSDWPPLAADRQDEVRAAAQRQDEDELMDEDEFMDESGDSDEATRCGRTC